MHLECFLLKNVASVSTFNFIKISRREGACVAPESCSFWFVLMSYLEERRSLLVLSAFHFYSSSCEFFILEFVMKLSVWSFRIRPRKKHNNFLALTFLKAALSNWNLSPLGVCKKTHFAGHTKLYQAIPLFGFCGFALVDNFCSEFVDRRTTVLCSRKYKLYPKTLVKFILEPSTTANSLSAWNVLAYSVCRKILISGHSKAYCVIRFLSLRPCLFVYKFCSNFRDILFSLNQRLFVANTRVNIYQTHAGAVDVFFDNQVAKLKYDSNVVLFYGQVPQQTL